MTATAFARPKEMDSVLLRIPAELKEFAATTAQEENISANTLYSAGVLHASFLYGVLPHVVGHPDNLLALATELDRAASTGDPVFGALHVSDWEQAQWLLSMLNSMGWIRDLKVRPEIRMESAVAYAYIMSKSGRVMWPAFGASMRHLLADCTKAEEVDSNQGLNTATMPT